MQIEVFDGALLRVIGPKDAPILLFVPAFGDCGVCYNGVFGTDLAQRYRLVALDLWGFGASPARADVQSFADFCEALERLVSKLTADGPIGLIAHSIAGSMAVEVAHSLGEKVAGVFSIEGNLTPDDAMFTGRANNFDDPLDFKASFLDDIWALGQESEALRHYYAGARMGDPRTMWSLGRDAGRVSEENRLGHSFRKLKRPALYYWSKESTPEATQEWIATAGIRNETYLDAGHWPMVDQPEATAERIGRFFDELSFH